MQYLSNLIHGHLMIKIINRDKLSIFSYLFMIIFSSIFSVVYAKSNVISFYELLANMKLFPIRDHLFILLSYLFRNFILVKYPISWLREMLDDFIEELKVICRIVKYQSSHKKEKCSRYFFIKLANISEVR